MVQLICCKDSTTGEYTELPDLVTAYVHIKPPASNPGCPFIIRSFALQWTESGWASAGNNPFQIDVSIIDCQESPAGMAVECRSSFKAGTGPGSEMCGVYPEQGYLQCSPFLVGFTAMPVSQNCCWEIANYEIDDTTPPPFGEPQPPVPPSCIPTPVKCCLPPGDGPDGGGEGGGGGPGGNGPGGCGGDNNLTKQTQYTTSSVTRVTLFSYDWRNRNTDTDGEIDYFQKVYYDNLNRPIKTERYDTTSSGNLVARSVENYDDLGHVYQSIQYGVNPSTGTIGNTLTSNTWYDANGNTIKSLPAGSDQFTKYQYDSLGRQTKQFVGYDLDETNYGDASTVTGDTILQQVETVYNDASRVIEAITKQRYHNAPATQTGELQNPSTTPKARVIYNAYYSDGIGRTVATASYGTNGGTALTRSSTIPTRSDTILVTTMEYDSARNQKSVTNPASMAIEMQYDDAGRETKKITNPQSSSSSSSGGTCQASDDSNVTVRTAYNADGNVKSITAENSVTGDQTTQFIYGTTLADSTVASSLLKRKEIYPDSVDSSDVILFSYNRQQQTTTVTDQGGTVHTYDYDKLGRQTQDRITTLGTGVDGAVRRIASTYDVRGMRKELTSYDNAAVGSGTIVNEILHAYNDFSQLTTEYQSHGGTVNTSTTPKVQYAYANGSDNTIRPTSLTYPNGRELNYDYGTSDGFDDAVSRVASLVDNDGTTHLVDYSYLGAGTFVIADDVEPDLKWTLADLSGSNDPDTGDIYSGFDRFGGIKDNRWYDYGNPSDADRIKYGYNRASNRTYRENTVADALGKHFDELYGNDAIQRLKDLERGTLNGLSITHNFSVFVCPYRGDFVLIRLWSIWI